MENAGKISGKQVLAYVCSLVILGCGIAMNTKTRLGVSPVISVAYNIAVIFHIPIGVMTFLYYCFLILLQFLLLKGKLPLFQTLQILASLITSLFIQIFDFLLPVPDRMAVRVMMLVLAISLTGIGASLSITMRIVPNPADGLADVVGKLLHRDLGFGKNVLDAACILVALAIGFISGRGFLGIGAGTVAAVIFTGRVVAFFHPVSAAVFRRVRGGADE